MFKPSAITKLAFRRRSIASMGVAVFGLLFHFGVTSPRAMARADAPKGMQRLRAVFGRSFSATSLMFSGKSPTSLFGDAFHGALAPLNGFPNAVATPQDMRQAELTPGAETIADPALLRTLQIALREKRDAEYIRRLRVFHRKLSPIFCPPLPSYSLKNLTNLSDSERYIASCHEKKQLQARCTIPSSPFEPMRCPEAYQWDIHEQWQEEERKWLAERTTKTR